MTSRIAVKPTEPHGLASSPGQERQDSRVKSLEGSRGQLMSECLIMHALIRKSLELQKEEIVLRTSNCCATSVQKRPYAQLNLVEHRSICFGMCNAINSDLAPIDEDGNGGIIPGCGCDSVYVQEIVRELNLRKEGRGKVAQMRQQKYMLEKITQLSIKVPMMLKALGVEYPPSDATLRRLFSEPPDMRPLPEVIALEPLPDFGTNQYEASAIPYRA